MFLWIVSVSLAPASSQASAGPTPPMDAAEIRLALEQLQVVGSALYVAAHPDDENTALLAWLEGEKKVRAAYLSITRGDGGQNLIGYEAGDLLGVIRTQELLAARRVDHAEQFFTRAVDFGYSKTPEETMAIWGRDSVLADVVWTIRSFRPDVIITRFGTDGSGGHGHHTASAILAHEAFEAAADPSRFPEQLRFVRPWRAKRLVWNNWRPRPEAPAGERPSPPLLTVDVGTYNSLLGRSYSEIAGESRSMHKSQGFGSPERRGSLIQYFEQTRGDSASRDLFEGVDLSWSRVAQGEKVAELLARAQKAYDPGEPHRIVPLLAQALAAMRALPADPIVDHKRSEMIDVMRSCAGLWLEAIATRPGATPGGRVQVMLSALNRSSARLVLDRIELPFGAVAMTVRPVSPPSPAGAAPAPSGADTTRREARDLELPFNRAVAAEAAIALPADPSLTQPYWLVEEPAKGLHRVASQTSIGRPQNTPALMARVVIRFEAPGMAAVPLEFDVPVVYRWTDPVLGERYRPFEVTPPATIEMDASAYLFSGAGPREVRVTVRSHTREVAGEVRLRLPAGWRADPPFHRVLFSEADAESAVAFRVHPGATGTGRIVAEIELGGARWSHRMVRLDHSHVPIQTLFPEAFARLVRADVAHSGETVGYVMGSGDRVPDALHQIGYRVRLLGDDDIANGSWGDLDAVVIGVRAYNTRPRLKALQRRLLDYVRDGGTLVVQYNTAEPSLVDRLGPHPFTISRERVTVEEAPVRRLAPDHPLLTRPNRITDADFEGWIQERGLYFASPWAPEYQTLLSCNDPGEPPRDGGLLYARHGKGVFLYTGYAWFRQLPAGVPGAYRLFANLVSAGRVVQAETSGSGTGRASSAAAKGRSSNR